MSNEKKITIPATAISEKPENIKKEIICPKCGCKEILPSSSPNGFKYECVICCWTF